MPRQPSDLNITIPDEQQDELVDLQNG